MTLDTSASALLQQRPARDCGAPALRHKSCGSRSTGPRWHCAATHGHQEFRALTELQNQGFDAYLPLHLDRSHRPVQERIVPLFSGYLFIRFDAVADSWGAIRNTRGIWALLMDGIRPASLPVGVVESLIARTSPRGIVDDPGTSPAHAYLVPGDRGRVTDGPLAGWEGLCTMSGKDRVKLLLDLFGAAREVEFKRDMVSEA